MKLILSRKGFDSSSGGVPSPILPDGRLLSLPIPDRSAKIRYCDIADESESIARLVGDLTRGKVSAKDGAHLDPDLIAGHLPRKRGWRPAFGQVGAAQGHLRNQGIAPGDLFIFFGLFREAEIREGRYRWVKDSTPKHIIWSWLQVGDMLPVSAALAQQKPWLADHPHLQRLGDANNMIYLASPSLTVKGYNQSHPGAGVFSHYDARRQLTAAAASSPSQWTLPKGFYPARGRVPLSFHSDRSRWRRRRDYVELQSVARGQEFVLDLAQYPEISAWLADLLATSRVHGSKVGPQSV